MLQSFGDKVKGSKILGYLIIGIISIPFALFGIQSYLGGNSQAVVAKVNEVEISIRDFDKETQRQRQLFAEKFDGKIPDAFNLPELFKNQALDSLIKKEILTQYLNQYQFAISNNDLSKKIVSDQTFLKDGKFDRKFYEAQVTSLGYSIPQFENFVREYAKYSQVQDGLIASSFILEMEDKKIKQLLNQKRQISIYKFNNNDYEKEIKIDEDSVKKYYDENKFNYQYSEQVKVAYIELTTNQIAEDINVTEQELRAQYDVNKALYKSKEKRKASHILLKVKPSDSDEIKEQTRLKLIELKEKILAGEDFSKVAKENSQDIGSKNQGGDLGLIERGFMVKPFEDALYELKKGQLSDPVLTKFGYHLINLIDIETPEIQPFEAIKKDLEKDLKLKKADATFYDISEKIASYSYENPDNLDAVSEGTGIKIKTTNWLDKNSTEGISAIAKVRNAIFSQPVFIDRQNSELVEIQDNHVIVLRIAEYKAAKPKTYNEVKDLVLKELKSKKLLALLNSKADKLIDNLKKDKTVSVDEENKGMVTRNDTSIKSQLISTLFKLKVSDGEIGISEPIQLNNGVAVITSNRIDKPVVKESSIDMENLTNRGLQDYNNWINALKEKSEITIFKNAIE